MLHDRYKHDKYLTKQPNEKEDSGSMELIISHLTYAEVNVKMYLCLIAFYKTIR